MTESVQILPLLVLLMGVAITRAEICMIVMQRGLQLGDWAVPPNIFSAMVFVCTITSILVPISLDFIFKQLPPIKEGNIHCE